MSLLKSLIFNTFHIMDAINQVLRLRQIIEVSRTKALPALVKLEITRIVQKQDQKLKMKFCLAQNLSKKEKATLSNAQQRNINPFLNPDPALLITQLGQRHNLLFNKFNIFESHLLVVTKEYESQQSPISLLDITQAALAFSALKGLLFYNGGKLSGASQPHKHLQILPQQGRNLPIFVEIQKFVNQKRIQYKNQLNPKRIIKFPHFNFKHGIIAIQNTEHLAQLAARICQAYNTLYQFLKITNQFNESKKDYNLIACQGFVAIFLRKKQMAFDKLSVNSVGFLGSLLFKDHQILQQFLQNEKINPLSILSDICQTQNEAQNYQKK